MGERLTQRLVRAGLVFRVLGTEQV
jgi:hypothetical protein